MRANVPRTNPTRYARSMVATPEYRHRVRRSPGDVDSLGRTFIGGLDGTVKPDSYPVRVAGRFDVWCLRMTRWSTNCESRPHGVGNAGKAIYLGVRIGPPCQECGEGRAQGIRRIGSQQSHRRPEPILTAQQIQQRRNESRRTARHCKRRRCQSLTDSVSLQCSSRRTPSLMTEPARNRTPSPPGHGAKQHATAMRFSLKQVPSSCNVDGRLVGAPRGDDVADAATAGGTARRRRWRSRACVGTSGSLGLRQQR